MKTTHHLGAFCVLFFSLLTTCPAWATDQLDLSVALKTLPLLTNKMTSPASVAIIYDSVSPESKADAEAIKSIIDGGMEAPGNLKLKAQLMSTSELLGLAGIQIAFLARGLPVADYNKIGAAAFSAGVLTICTDINCVKENKCVLGVTSKPQVEVYYSPIAAEAAGISFAAAFTMLAKQVGAM
jgi:hypothetical protein